MDGGGTGSRDSLRTAPRPMAAGGGWRIYVGLGFSLVALALAVRDVDLTGVGNAIGAADGMVLAIALGSYLLTVTAKAARWRLLLSTQFTPSLSRAFSVLSIGLLVNAVAPARLGELARAYVLGESESRSKAFVLGTIAVEKLLEVLSLSLAVALLLSQLVLPGWLLEPVQASSAILALFFAAATLLVWRRRLAIQALDWVASKDLAGWPGWLARQAEQGFRSLSVFGRPRLMLGLVLWSLVILVLGASTNYLVCTALGLSPPILAPLFLLVVLQAGVAVPSSPGKIGVFHYLTILALSVFGVPREAALGVGVVLHLTVYLPTVLIGAWCLSREGLTWRRLSEAASRLRDSARAPR
jgi:uncharacterized protein (TIRG00374 family)